jgi:RNA polymerase primary sigma factor
MKADPFSDYLESVGRVPLLTAEEEIHLGHAVQEAKRIQESTPPKERTTAQKRTVRRGKKAKDRMVAANLRLVVCIAKKWSNAQLKLEPLDLVQEGNLGLIRAVEKFDPTRGYKFSTYAYWWIRQGIGRCISYQNRLIRLPGTAMVILGKARDFTVMFHAEHGKAPTTREIADHCGTTEESMAHYLSHRSDVTSLDTPSATRSWGDMSPLKDILADPNSLEDISFFDASAEQELKSYMAQRLTENQQYILTYHFGLDGKTIKTFTEISKELGISRERVRQIEAQAVNKLKVYMAQSMTGKLCS